MASSGSGGMCHMRGVGEGGGPGPLSPGPAIGWQEARGPRRGRVRSARDRLQAGWWRVAPGPRPLRAERYVVDLVLWAQVSTYRVDHIPKSESLHASG